MFFSFFSWRPWSEWTVAYDHRGRVVGRRIRLAVVRLAPWLSVDAVLSIGAVKHPGSLAELCRPSVYEHIMVGGRWRRIVSSMPELAVAEVVPEANRRGRLNAIGAFFAGSSADVSFLMNSVDGTVTRAQLASVATGHGVKGALCSNHLSVTLSDLSEFEYNSPDDVLPAMGNKNKQT